MVPTVTSELAVCTALCSDCGQSRTIAVEQTALAVVPASCPGRREVLVEVTATVLEGCSRCC